MVASKTVAACAKLKHKVENTWQEPGECFTFTLIVSSALRFSAHFGGIIHYPTVQYIYLWLNPHTEEIATKFKEDVTSQC